MADKDTLYDRIGGGEAVSAAVEIFYQKVLADDSISDFFTDVDMLQQKRKQKAFLAFVFGGPAEYSGKDMRSAHDRLVDNGLNGAHFDAVVGHLADTLKELNVPADIIGEVAAIAGSVRGDVLGE